MNTNTELSINTEVVEKMAEIAALEVEGVIGLSKKAIDLKSAVKTQKAFKGVKIESENGALKITVYICIAGNARSKDVAQKVQENVKEKIQNMTGTAVTKVNVNVADIDLKSEETEN